MAEQTKKRTRYTTPVGEAKWPHITKPDYKYKDAGEYHTKLRIGKEDFEENLKGVIDEIYNDAVKRAKADNAKNKKKPPKVLDTPYYLDEETNEYEVSFKSKYSWVDKVTKEVKTRDIPIFNSAGAIIKNRDLKVGNGTTMRVSFVIDPFHTALGVGVSLKLEAVKILNLVEYGANADSYGFGEDESDSYPAEDFDESQGSNEYNEEEDDAPF
ncbi:MAG: hypothetical protein RBS24_05635 [Bacilli bacterium]|nr:hypothetical protein [Bacilli bacterium]